MIPDYQTLMLPVLRLAAEGEASINAATETVSDLFNLTEDERNELLPSGKLTTIRSRVHWAKAYLTQAGLVEPTKRGHFRITDRGRAVLQNAPERIDNAFLDQFEEFRRFKQRGKKSDGDITIPQTQADASASPEDVLTAAYQQITDAFITELIDRLIAGSPAFFEKAIVELLLAMGYGGSSVDAGRAIGKAGDDGVDGVIDQDPLGVDQIYIQAKRYKPDNIVGPAAIREFFGALSMKKAQKGIFVTTSGFTKSALETATQIGGRIVLIDGHQLGRLMVRYNVGCRDKYALHVKDFDEDFFD
ncbi:restriction endonuclease [Altererythrobacter lauratis]|uniref:Restriction endonuclease n=1 Tax=Alteraurantiacibacter lauratis TaxID=2054627 RepID=A0ABV7ECM9_9SPHN